MKVKIYTKLSDTQSLLDLFLSKDQIMILRKKHKKRKKLERKELIRKVKKLYRNQGYKFLLVSNIYPGNRLTEIGDLGTHTVYAPNPDWK